MKPPIPLNEHPRVDLLRQYGILDTAAEPVFDEIAQRAAAICQTPIGLLAFVDRDRVWFKASTGLEFREIPRDTSFCAYAICQNELYVVPDLLADERFSHNPLVTQKPHLRFYAGMPLLSPEGLVLGTLCVIDRKPRELTPEQTDKLKELAQGAVLLLEIRRAAGPLSRAPLKDPLMSFAGMQRPVSGEPPLRRDRRVDSQTGRRTRSWPRPCAKRPWSATSRSSEFAERLFAGEFDMMILLTGVGTRLLHQALATRYPPERFAEALRRITVVARGPKPAAVLRGLDVPVTDRRAGAQYLARVAGRHRRSSRAPHRRPGIRTPERRAARRPAPARRGSH